MRIAVENSTTLIHVNVFEEYISTLRLLLPVVIREQIIS